MLGSTHSKNSPKAASIKDSRKGGGPRSGPPPLWKAAEGRLLYGGWLSACFYNLCCQASNLEASKFRGAKSMKLDASI